MSDPTSGASSSTPDEDEFPTEAELRAEHDAQQRAMRQEEEMLEAEEDERRDVGKAVPDEAASRQGKYTQPHAATADHERGGIPSLAADPTSGASPSGLSLDELTAWADKAVTRWNEAPDASAPRGVKRAGNDLANVIEALRAALAELLEKNTALFMERRKAEHWQRAAEEEAYIAVMGTQRANGERDAALERIRLLEEYDKALSGVIRAMAECCPYCGGTAHVAACPKDFVSHEMAIDAGDPTMEGQSMGVEWAQCSYCGPVLDALRSWEAPSSGSSNTGEGSKT